MAPPKILPRFYHPCPWVQLLCFKFLHPPDVPQVSQTQRVLSNLSPSLPLLYHLSNSDIYYCMLGPRSHPWFFPCSSSRVNHQSLSHKCPYIPRFFSIATTTVLVRTPSSFVNSLHLSSPSNRAPKQLVRWIPTALADIASIPHSYESNALILLYPPSRMRYRLGETANQDADFTWFRLGVPLSWDNTTSFFWNLNSAQSKIKTEGGWTWFSPTKETASQFLIFLSWELFSEPGCCSFSFGFLNDPIALQWIPFLEVNQGCLQP